VLSRNGWIFTTGRFEDGDFAVNSILIDEAKRLRLLVGNYSRVGFNHPGPFLLYVQAAGELVFHDVMKIVPRPFNAHVLSAVILNAALVAGASATATRLAGSWRAGFGIALGALTLIWVRPGAFASTWFPHLYIWPFLLFVVATAGLLLLDARSLPTFALASAILVHGHVSFLTFVGGASVAVTARWVAADRRGRRVVVDRRSWVAAVLIMTLFLLPIVAHVVTDWPGELDEYWRYTQDSGAGGHSLREVARFVLGYWAPARSGALLALGLVAGAVVATVTTRPERVRRLLAAILAAGALATVLTAFYAARGVDDLSFEYVAEFSRVVPVLCLAVIATSLLLRSSERVLTVIVAFTVAAAAATSAWRAPPSDGRWIPDVAARIDELTEGTAVVSFDHVSWPPTAGLVEQLRRTSGDVCVADPAWTFLFSKYAMCGPADLTNGTDVYIGSPGSRPTEAGDTTLDEPQGGVVVVVDG